MKKIVIYIVSVFVFLSLPRILTAQTLNVYTGQVCTCVAASAHKMPYSNNGSIVTIAGKAFNVAEIDSMIIDDSSVAANSVEVTYSGTRATVRISGDVAPHLTVRVSGAHVSILQDAQVTTEITYRLQGKSENGSFYTEGSYKMTLALNGVSLTNPTGAAIDVQNGKRIAVKLVSGTTNTLVDGTNGTHKACFNVKGHPEFEGSGTLHLTGNTKHAFKSGEYTELKANTGLINILQSAGDGMHVGQYLEMKGGSITMDNIGDDGLQVEITNDATDELNGQAIISGGSMQMNIGGMGAKGLKADSLITISGGTFTITTTGDGTYDTTTKDTKTATCISSDYNILISGGSFTLKNTGSGGRCIKCDGILEVSGGQIDAQTSGSEYRYSNSLTSSSKAIKSLGNLIISGGAINAYSKTSEAIESKSNISVSGGVVYAESSDDAINAGGDLTFSGGYTYGRSTGNDGMDSNGNMYVNGGVVYAAGARSPEVAFDANSEARKQLYVTGGTLIAFGGLERGANTSQPYVSTSSYTANTSYALYEGNTLLVTFKAPSTVGGTGITISSGSLTSGTSYSLKSGVTISGGTSYFGGYYFENAEVSGGSGSTNVTAASGTYSGGSDDRPGGGPGGGGRPW